MKSRIMVLNDGETFTALAGCQIVEVDDNLTVDQIESCLKTLYRDNRTCKKAKILGGFTCLNELQIDGGRLGRNVTIKIE